MYLTTTTQYLVHSPQLLPSLALLLLAYIIRLSFWNSRGTKSRKMENSPTLGRPGDASFLGPLKEGYHQVKYFLMFFFLFWFGPWRSGRTAAGGVIEKHSWFWFLGEGDRGKVIGTDHVS